MTGTGNNSNQMTNEKRGMNEQMTKGGKKDRISTPESAGVQPSLFGYFAI